MARNVEIKARLTDYTRQVAIVRELAQSEPEVLDQEDIFFHTPRGRLKLRLLAPDLAHLIYYERPDVAGPKESSYEIFPTNAPCALRKVLSLAYGDSATVRVTNIGRRRRQNPEVHGYMIDVTTGRWLKETEREDQAAPEEEGLEAPGGVKRKQRVTRRTVKNRVRTPEMVTAFDGAATAFVRDYYPLDPGRLEIRLWNTFTRVTLVSTVRCERLTLDFDVRFQNDESAASLRGLTIVEVKQERASRESDWMDAMRAQGIRPTGFSKYCVGVTLLYPQVKTNHFKPKLLLMERLLQDGRNDGRRH